MSCAQRGQNLSIMIKHREGLSIGLNVPVFSIAVFTESCKLLGTGNILTKTMHGYKR